MPLVIDASVGYFLAVAERERSEIRALLLEELDHVGSVMVPTLWIYELTSTMAKQVHFGSLTDIEARDALHNALKLPVELVLPDNNLSMEAFGWSQRLNRANAYDSHYLALAKSLSCELWTLDQRLINAVGQEWVRKPV